MDDQNMLFAARQIIQREAEVVAALAQQLDAAFIAAVRVLLACDGHVLVTGVGTSGAVARRLAHLLTCCGTPALYLHPGDAQHGMAGAITAKNVVIALSKGGESAEITFVVTYARQQGAQVIAITEQPESTLGKLADVALIIHTPPAADQLNYIATGSSLAVAAVGDALCGLLLRLRGRTLDAFAATHPGGAVGQTLLGKPDE
ncbi:MAG: SIS domain-containing protein [Anaerolineae bacterium]|nr:SIS domain-containing protein [Anaerolineae bacterium]